MLYLDFDGPFPERFEQKLFFVFRTIRITPVFWRIDRTAHGYHVIVGLPVALEPFQTLALQAILGSDWRRESLNWFRLYNMPANSRLHLENWNILYEYKIYSNNR